MEFKGTKGELELKYVSGICIGIGTVGNYSQITANTILPDTDEEYEKEKEEIESNMKLYSCAPGMLEMLKESIKEINHLKEHYRDIGHCSKYLNLCEELIKKATTI